MVNTCTNNCKLNVKASWDNYKQYHLNNMLKLVQMITFHHFQLKV